MAASASGKRSGQIVELTIIWGSPGEETVLGVHQLDPYRGLRAGEDEGCTLLLPESVLGAPSVQLLAAGSPTLLVPPGATLTVNGEPCSLGELPIAEDDWAEIALGKLCLCFSLARREVPPRVNTRKVGHIVAAVGVSVVAHAALAALAFAALPSPSAEVFEQEAERFTILQAVVERANEDSTHAAEPKPEPPRPTAPEPPRPAANVAPPGAAWRPNVVDDGLPDAPRSVQEAQARAKGSTIAATLARIADGAPDGFGPPRDPKLEGATSAMFVVTEWEAFGIGGGGRGLSDGPPPPRHIMMHGFASAGSCADHPKCRESLKAPLPQDHASAVALPRPSMIAPAGAVAPGLVDQVVRAHYDPFRACYDVARRRNPSLAGVVQMGFVVSTMGNVTSAFDAGGNLDDDAVRACVVSAFGKLVFPPQERPTGGRYGFVFQP